MGFLQACIFPQIQYLTFPIVRSLCALHRFNVEQGDVHEGSRHITVNLHTSLKS